MKKFLALILALIMAFSLVACGTTDDSTTEEVVEESPEEVVETEEVVYDFYEEAYQTVPIEHVDTTIGNCPATIWGKEADNVIIAIHGYYGNRWEGTKVVMTEVAEPLGYQVISFDMHGHGEQIGVTDWIMEECAKECQAVVDYAFENYENVSVFGDSFGCYMIMTALQDYDFERVMFISPAFDMPAFIEGLYEAAGVTKEELEEEGTIENNVGLPFQWSNQEYMDSHQITSVQSPCYALYNEGDEYFTQDSVKTWCDKLGIELTIGTGGHWLHTNEQLIVYREWLENILGN